MGKPNGKKQTVDNINRKMTVLINKKKRATWLKDKNGIYEWLLFINSPKHHSFVLAPGKKTASKNKIETNKKKMNGNGLNINEFNVHCFFGSYCLFVTLTLMITNGNNQRAK